MSKLDDILFTAKPIDADAKQAIKNLMLELIGDDKPLRLEVTETETSAKYRYLFGVNQVKDELRQKVEAL